MTRPIAIRGKTYPSAKIAALALGVKPQTISIARKNNRLETVGLGLPGNASGDSNRRETWLLGKRYDSREQCAKAIGIGIGQLSTFLSVAKHLGIEVR